MYWFVLDDYCKRFFPSFNLFSCFLADCGDNLVRTSTEVVHLGPVGRCQPMPLLYTLPQATAGCGGGGGGGKSDDAHSLYAAVSP